jgi:hypothetical protein
MIAERAAAYVLAVVCVFQTLHPSGRIKPHYLRNLDVQIGRLRVQATCNGDSTGFANRIAGQKSSASPAPMPLLHSWGKPAKRLRICIDDSGCLTAWLDGTSQTWLISRDRI